MTRLLDTKEFRRAVENAVSQANTRITILSAYLKYSALSHLMDMVPAGVEVTVASRFRVGDLASGASDLEAAKLLMDSGATFGISSRLHGKVFLVDDREMFIGSSNLTGSGLGLVGAGNDEFGTHYQAKQPDVSKLYKFLGENVRWLDESTVRAMELDLMALPQSQSFDAGLASRSWSFEAVVFAAVDGIWFKELPPCTPAQTSNYIKGDGEVGNQFIGEDFAALDSLDELQRAFKSSVSYRWLMQKLCASVATQMRFGELTSLAHSDLLDDPMPYRSSIKQAVAHLFAWAEIVPEDFIIEKYNHSQAIGLRNRKGVAAS